MKKWEIDDRVFGSWVNNVIHLLAQIFIVYLPIRNCAGEIVWKKTDSVLGLTVYNHQIAYRIEAK